MSKAEKRRLKQLEKAAKASSPASKQKLLEGVALAKETAEEGGSSFTLGYQYYKDDLCQVKAMPVAALRKVLEGYKNITRCTTEAEIYNLPMDMKKVNDSGYYSQFFAGLSPDAEVSEFDATSYRGMFFIDRAAKVVQMVALVYHPPEKKQK